jgi:hypothetical protein
LTPEIAPRASWAPTIHSLINVDPCAPARHAKQLIGLLSSTVHTRLGQTKIQI